MSLSSRLDRIESELRARSATREKLIREVPYWEDPKKYLEQMVASGEITDDQRNDVVLIHHVIVRPIHKFNEKGEIVGVIGSEVVPLEELRCEKFGSEIPQRSPQQRRQR